jgi:hypothetical protein
LFRIKLITSGLLMALAMVSVPALAQDAGDPANVSAPEKEYSPYLGHNYPDKVLWGGHAPAHILFRGRRYVR